MQLFKSLAIVQALALSLSAVNALIVRQSNDRDDFINAITQPTTGTVIQPGQIFPFTYTGGSRCNLLYTGVKIWLLDHQPTLSEFNSDGDLQGASLYYWGEYVTINIRMFNCLCT